MVVVCRICLKRNDNALEYCSLNTSAQKALELCVPKLDLSLVPDAFICGPCLNELSLAHNFTKKCLRTDELIRNYIQIKSFPTTGIDLNLLVQVEKNTTAPPRTSVTPFKATINLQTNLTKTLMPQIKSESVNDCFVEESPADIKPLQMLPLANTVASIVDKTQTQLKFEEVFVPDANALPNSEDYILGPNITNDFTPVVRTTFECHVCNYHTQTQEVYFKHMTIHTAGGKRPHKCVLCDFKTLEKNVFKLHMRLHTSEQELPRQKKRSKEKEKSRVGTPAGNKPKSFVCSGCGFASLTMRGARVHMNKHDKEQSMHENKITYMIYEN